MKPDSKTSFCSASAPTQLRETQGFPRPVLSPGTLLYSSGDQKIPSNLGSSELFLLGRQSMVINFSVYNVNNIYSVPLSSLHFAKTHLLYKTLSFKPVIRKSCLKLHTSLSAQHCVPPLLDPLQSLCSSPTLRSRGDIRLGLGPARTVWSQESQPLQTVSSPVPVRSAEAPGDGSGGSPEDDHDGKRGAKKSTQVCSRDPRG